jgi:hypothetical protein
VRQAHNLGDGATSVQDFFCAVEEVSSSGVFKCTVPTSESIKSNKRILAKYLELETLIIDNVSDISPSLFTQIDLFLRSLKDSNHIFGGVRLLVSANFYMSFHPWFVNDAPLLFNEKTFLRAIDEYVSVSNGSLCLSDGNSKDFYQNIYPSFGPVDLKRASDILLPLIADPAVLAFSSCLFNTAGGSTSDFANLSDDKSSVISFLSFLFVVIVRTKNLALFFNSRIIRLRSFFQAEFFSPCLACKLYLSVAVIWPVDTQ